MCTFQEAKQRKIFCFVLFSKQNKLESVGCQSLVKSLWGNAKKLVWVIILIAMSRDICQALTVKSLCLHFMHFLSVRVVWSLQTKHSAYFANTAAASSASAKNKPEFRWQCEGCCSPVLFLLESYYFASRNIYKAKLFMENRPCTNILVFFAMGLSWFIFLSVICSCI